MPEDLTYLVAGGDSSELLLAVDRMCAAGEWADLSDLAARCREAVERGLQLWPVAEHIDYRLALEAPGEWAAPVARIGAGRFAWGPLTEVAAGTHDWAALAADLPDELSAATVAEERAIRGEDLRDAAVPTELPPVLAPWEPSYELPVYRDRSAQFPGPEVMTRTFGPAGVLPDPPPGRVDAAADALRAVFEVWEEQSEAEVSVAAVDVPDARADGPTDGCAELARYAASRAVAALAPVAVVQPVSPGDALALLQWAGASGGVHGRRRGGAAGRFAVWWALAALGDLAWPQDVTAAGDFERAVGEVAESLVWFRWSTGDADGGWTVRLAVVDLTAGCAWAIGAADADPSDGHRE